VTSFNHDDGAVNMIGKALRDETAEGFDDWNPD
jgi:hypothetical protein